MNVFIPKTYRPKWKRTAAPKPVEFIAIDPPAREIVSFYDQLQQMVSWAVQRPQRPPQYTCDLFAEFARRLGRQYEPEKIQVEPMKIPEYPRSETVERVVYESLTAKAYSPHARRTVLGISVKYE